MKALKRLSAVFPAAMPLLCNLLWRRWRAGFPGAEKPDRQIEKLKELLHGCPWWAEGHLALGAMALEGLHNRELALNSAKAVLALIANGRAGTSFREKAEELARRAGSAPA